MSDRRTWNGEQLGGSKGVSCDKCHSRLNRVYVVNNRNRIIRRVRVCQHCGHQFVTIEMTKKDLEEQ